MRAFVCAAVLLSACGAAPPSPSTPPRAALTLPEVGTRYEVLHRVRVRFDGAEEGVLRARLVLDVVRARSTEIDLHVEASLLEEDQSVAGFDELEVTLNAAGQLVGPPRSSCADPDFDELLSTRLLTAILGSRPLRSEPDARTFDGVIASELDETQASVTFTREAADDASLEVRASTSLTLRAATLFGATYRGAVRAEAHHRLSLVDLLEGRSRTTLRGEVQGTRSDGTHHGLLEVTSDTEVRRMTEDEARATRPRHCDVGFSSELVVRAVAEQLDTITGCYEQALASDPALRGRLRIEFTVTEAGETEDVVVASSTVADGTSPPWNGAVQCVIRVLDGLSFGSGPADGARFAYPFVFEPE